MIKAAVEPQQYQGSTGFIILQILVASLACRHITCVVIFDGTVAQPHLTSNELRKQLPWKHLRHQTVYSTKKLNATH